MNSSNTRQPVWQLIANLGDATPILYGGFFVYVDTTGVYSPECVLLTPLDKNDCTNGDPVQWEARRFTCESCTFINGVLSDNPFHPDKPAWFATPYNPDRPQDGSKGKLESIAETFGTTPDELIALFVSSDATDRAQAWRMVGEYFGFDNLDSYPQMLTRKDVFNRYRAECFPRSVRRVSRASVCNSYGFTVRVGARVSFRCVNDPTLYAGTVKGIDRASGFAKAYGPQITFSDHPSTVTANDCFAHAIPSGERGPFAIKTI